MLQSRIPESYIGLRRVVVARRANLLIGTVLMAAAGSHAKATTCTDLLAAQFPHVVINSAQDIPAGTYQPPGSPFAFPDLPAFCRVTATVSPVADSSIAIEVWLPETGWNGRYQQVGNHGYGSGIFWSEMAPQLRRGFATGATDDGHPGSPSAPFQTSWAIGHPAKIVDFAYRAVHELAENAKLLIASFYGKPQVEAYFNGCSDGGREGLKAAQMFPRDFNGILIGGVPSNAAGGATQQLVASQYFTYEGVTGPAGENALRLALAASTKACDAKDGVVDGIISTPNACHWHPDAIICHIGQEPSTCLSSSQADAIQASLDPLRNPVNGKFLYSGFAQGSQFDQIQFYYWAGLAPFGVATYQIVFQDPNYNGSTFNLQTDYPKAVTALRVFNATNPDLRAFAAAGGKIIQWHGWGDAAFTPGWEIKYYNDVIGAIGGEFGLKKVQEFYRFFLLPGVGHCGHPSDAADGVPPGDDLGPDDIGAENQAPVSDDPEHDAVSALMRWTEHGVAPSKLIATKFNNNTVTDGVQLQRPVCPYPAKAVWKGIGNTNRASSFICE